MTESPLPDGVKLSPFDPDFREDPYPILHELRRRAPVHRDEPLKRWHVTRHDDVEWVLLPGIPPRAARSPGAFAALLERFPRLEPSSRPHEYRQVPSFRGLAHYWVRSE